MKSDKIKVLKKLALDLKLRRMRNRFLSFIWATEVLQSFISGHNTNDIEQTNYMAWKWQHLVESGVSILIIAHIICKYELIM